PWRHRRTTCAGGWAGAWYALPRAECTVRGRAGGPLSQSVTGWVNGSPKMQMLGLDEELPHPQERSAQPPPSAKGAKPAIYVVASGVGASPAVLCTCLRRGGDSPAMSLRRAVAPLDVTTIWPQRPACVFKLPSGPSRTSAARRIV